MDVTSYLLGKKSSGGGGGGGDTRWQEIGYEEEPSASKEDFSIEKNIYDNWDASITNRSYAFTGNTYNDNPIYIFPKVDTSNVTNMQGMFYSNLTLRETDIDYSRCTNTNDMYYNCASLIYANNVIPSWSARMDGIFKYCYNLKEINYLRITGNSNNKDIISGRVQKYINNLKINELEIVWGANSSIGALFNYCLNLNILKITFFGGNQKNDNPIFANCTLTNNTIKEVLKFCTNLQAKTTKTLKSIGLTQNDATTATTMAEWADLESAGWTTGY